MFNSFSTLVGIAGYILSSLGMYTIAKRRGINKPWTAWVPVANVWLLGCISDQYRYVARGQVKSKRKTLPALTCVVLVLMVVIIGLAVSLFFDLLPYLPEDMLTLETMEMLGSMSDSEIEILMEDTFAQIGQPTPAFERTFLMKGALAGLAAFAMSVVAIILAVLTYMAYFDLFASADPRNASMYLTLGILENAILFGILLPVFVFICRDKDMGMPPRQPQIVDMPPTWNPPEPPYYGM